MRMTADTALLAWINDHAGRGANVGAARDMRETA
jgi:hypothetical protein